MVGSATASLSFLRGRGVSVMVLVFSPFGISITNCSSRNCRGIRLPVQPPSAGDLVGGPAGASGGGTDGTLESRHLNTATLWGATVDQAARCPQRRRAHTQ